MNPERVTVIDGPLPADVWQRPGMEPPAGTAPELLGVAGELRAREPLFHRPECGVSREALEKSTAPGFWEVGASGRRYGRAFVLDVLEERYRTPHADTWEVSDFQCAALGPGHYLATYTLAQGPRVTRRSTIWRRGPDGWQAVFHQGPPVSVPG